MKINFLFDENLMKETELPNIPQEFNEIWIVDDKGENKLYMVQSITYMITKDENFVNIILMEPEEADKI